MNALVVATTAGGYYMAATGSSIPAARARDRRCRHCARRERRGGDQPGDRARHRPADGPHASAADRRRPHERRRGPGVIALCARGIGIVLLWSARISLAAGVALATLAHLRADLHAAQARIVARDDRRRRSGRAAAAHRLGRRPRHRLTASRRGRCSSSCFSGSCRTSSRSRGSTATTTRARGCRCCRSSIATALTGRQAAALGRDARFRSACCRSWRCSRTRAYAVGALVLGAGFLVVAFAFAVRTAPMPTRGALLRIADLPAVAVAADVLWRRSGRDRC